MNKPSNFGTVNRILDGMISTWEYPKDEFSVFIDENNFLHNEHGPAVESLEGEKWYFYHGKLHCGTNHAIIRKDGCQYWYMGMYFGTKEEWFEFLSLDEKRIAVWDLT